MSTRTLSVLAATIVIIALLLAGGWYWYTHTKDAAPESLNPVIFPNGTSNNTSGRGAVLPAPTETGGNTTVSGGSTGEPRLFQIHDRPIVSFVTFEKKKRPVARFMEQGSGNVYEYDFESKQKIRISNTSIPQIEYATWSPDGSVVAFQYEQDNAVHTAVGVLASTTVETDASFDKIYFLPENIRSIAISPDNKSVAYVLKTSNKGSLIVSRVDGAEPKIVFSSALTQWQVTWPYSTTLLVSSPAGEEGGVAYRIDSKTGSKTLIQTSSSTFGEVAGDSKGQLIATSPQTGFVSLFDPKFGSYSDLDQLSWVRKCSFVQGATSTVLCGEIPSSVSHKEEEWERGEYYTSDSLLAINFFMQYKQELIPKNEIGDRVFDMAQVGAVPRGAYVAFKNKMDGFMWGVRVPGGIR